MAAKHVLAAREAQAINRLTEIALSLASEHDVAEDVIAQINRPYGRGESRSVNALCGIVAVLNACGFAPVAEPEAVVETPTDTEPEQEPEISDDAPEGEPEQEPAPAKVAEPATDERHNPKKKR